MVNEFLKQKTRTNNGCGNSYARGNSSGYGDGCGNSYNDDSRCYGRGNGCGNSYNGLGYGYADKSGGTRD